MGAGLVAPVGPFEAALPGGVSWTSRICILAYYSDDSGGNTRLTVCAVTDIYRMLLMSRLGEAPTRLQSDWLCTRRTNPGARGGRDRVMNAHPAARDTIPQRAT